MKKYFMFAAVVTAGMLASCSSESLTGSDPKIETPDQADLVPIEIGVASSQTTGTTRGTGTVGGTVDYDPGDPTNPNANIWNGEQINVLMYQIDDNNLPTFNYVKAGGDNLYDNTILLITPLKAEAKASGIAKEPTATSADPYTSPATAQYKIKYYPAEGRSDFWGYYLGGYGSSYNASALTVAQAPKTYNATTKALDAPTGTGNVQAVGFTIDGTHDLMVAKAATGASNATGPTQIVGNESFEPTQIAAVTDANNAYKASYSAKAARKGLQPELRFKHLLSRLTFVVQPGNERGDGIKVTAIKVRSKDTGELIVAYLYNDDALRTAVGDNRIVWNAAQAELDYNDAALPQLTLKRRFDNDALTAYNALPPADPYRTANTLTAANIGQMVPIYPVELDWITQAEIDAVTQGDGSHADEINAGTPQAYPSSIGEALLVAPQQQYEVEIEYTLNAETARHWYQSTTLPITNYNPGEVTGDADEIPTTPLKATITRQDPANSFNAGESYKVIISLYGPEEIKITTTLTAWDEQADVIKIGED